MKTLRVEAEIEVDLTNSAMCPEEIPDQIKARLQFGEGMTVKRMRVLEASKDMPSDRLKLIQTLAKGLFEADEKIKGYADNAPAMVELNRHRAAFLWDMARALDIQDDVEDATRYLKRQATMEAAPLCAQGHLEYLCSKLVLDESGVRLTVRHWRTYKHAWDQQQWIDVIAEGDDGTVWLVRQPDSEQRLLHVCRAWPPEPQKT